MTWLRLLFLLTLFFLFFRESAAQPAKNYAPFGKVVTPKGDLRILLIYAGFDGFDGQQSVGSWKADAPLPPWEQKELFYSSDLEFVQDTVQRAFNISRFYFNASNPKHKFKITADVLPVRININPVNAGSFDQCNRLVLEQMKTLYPDFDWKPYDNRTNLPNYKFDNSISKPDHKPDYVIISYRYWSSWNPQPTPGMQYWANNYSRLGGLGGIDYNGYQFDGAGFTMGNFEGRPDSFYYLFLHEFAHELFSCPHYSGANWTSGNYFNLPSMGWDMMNQTGGKTCSAFERWLLGWTEIRHDLKTYHDNGTYEIRDIEASGDAIRIKIPHTDNQYLWIENHELNNASDHKPWRYQLKNVPPGTKGIPDKEPGVYMFIENVLADRHAINDGLVYDLNKVNGIYPLHAGGNFDYVPPEEFTMRPEEYWNNKLYWFERKEENPISGLNPYINYRGDMDRNGTINNVSGPFGAFNGMSDTESFPIVKEVLNGNPTLTYANTGGRNEDALPYRRSDAFQKGDQLGLGFNPVVINRPEYDWIKAQLKPYYLNGIAVSILENKNGVAKIQVLFNNTEITKSTRWCGNIILSQVPGSRKKYAANLQKGLTLSINQSLIPNKHLSPFVNKSILTIDSGAVLNLSPGSILKISEGSKIEIKAGGSINMEKNAMLILEDEGILSVLNGGNIFLDKSAEIQAPSVKNIIIKVKTGISRLDNITYGNK